MSKTVTLDITIIVLTGPDKPSLGLDHISHHIINQPVFIPDFLGLKLCLIGLLIDLFKDVLEPAVILLQDSVLGGHIKWVFPFKGELERAVSEVLNALIDVVHAHSDTTLTLKFEDLHALLFALSVLKHDFECTRSVYHEVCCFVLIAECVSADHNRLLPAWDQPWDVLDDNWFSEHCSVENVSDCAIGGFPHLLEVEFLDSGFIGSDGGALNSDFAFLNGVGSVNGDLIVGGISVFNAEVKVLDVEVEEGMDEVFFDLLPDDSGHFITIEFSDWVLNLDFFKLHQKRYFN